MSVSNYCGVVVQNGSYFVREIFENPTAETDLATLETIKEILKSHLSCGDENQEMAPVELAQRKSTLLKSLDRITREAAQRCYEREPFFQWAARIAIWKTISYPEQLKTEIDKRIEIEKNKMLSPEERRFIPELPSNCVEEIISYLAFSNLAVFARINQNTKQLQEREVWDRIHRYGYIGPSIQALQEDLHILMDDFPQTHSLEEPLRKIQKCLHSNSIFNLISMIAKGEDVAKLQALLRFGMDPNAQKHIKKDKEDPFYKVKKSLSKNVLGEFVLGGCVEGTRLLLEHKADPNLPLAGSLTPLHLVVGRAAVGDLELTQLLLDFGADPSLVDERGISPLVFAAKRLAIADLEEETERQRFLQDPIVILLLLKIRDLKEKGENAI